jgi:hypothetical protein
LININIIIIIIAKDICQRLAKFRKVNPQTPVEDRRDIPTVAFNTYFKDIDVKWPQEKEGFCQGTCHVLIINFLLSLLLLS